MSYGFKFLQGSFMIDNNGRITQVQGSEKVKKDFYKMLVSDLNGIYGTQVRRLMGSKDIKSSINLNLRQYLKDATYNFVQIQKQNPFLDDSEKVVNVSLNVWQDEEDKNQFDFNITLQLQSGQIIDDLPTQTLKIGA